MHGERCDATRFSELRDPYAIALITSKTGARLESYRHARCSYHRAEDFRHQVFIGEQCRAAQAVTYFFRRAAHVDVDDLGAEINIAPGGVGQGLGIRTGEL